MNDVQVGGVYRHYKGNMYKVIALATHSEAMEDMVVYQSVKDGQVWVRPKCMWNDVVDDIGTLRFSLCND